MSAQRRWSGQVLGRMAVIGVGQIGGSVALSARVAGAVTEVVAWSRTRDGEDSFKVTHAVFTFVAIDAERKPRVIAQQ